MSLGGVLRDVTVIAVGFSEAFNVVGKTIALVVAAMTGNISSFKQFREEFNLIAVESGEKIQRFKDHAYAGADGAKAVGAAVAGATPAVQAHGQAMQAAGTAAQGAATAQTQSATATTAATTATTAATTTAAARGRGVRGVRTHNLTRTVEHVERDKF